MRELKPLFHEIQQSHAKAAGFKKYDAVLELKVTWDENRDADNLPLTPA